MARDDKKQIIHNVHNSYWFEREIANTSNQYTSGDIVGGMGMLELRGADGSGGGGTDRVITIIDNAAVNMAMRIWFFRRLPNTHTNGTAFVPTLQDLIKTAGYVDIVAGDYETYGTRSFAQARTANLDFSCPDGRLYYYVEARGAGNFAAANKLYINFGHWPD